MSRHLGLSLIALLTVHLSSAQARILTPDVVYGDDNRVDYYAIAADPLTRPLADATVALLRTSQLTPHGTTTTIATVPYGQSKGLCESEPFYSQETAAFCSGFLVAPDLVVTAGHCIREASSCAQTQFVFGFRLEVPGEQPHSVPTDHVFSCRELVHSVALPRGEDFAVIRLDRPVDFVQPLALRSEGRPQVGDPLEVMGHPSGLPLKIAAGANVRAVQDQFLVANLDTYGGNSGSGVFSTASGQVEGVLVRGERDFMAKDGCYISYPCSDDGCRGEDVTLIERVLPYLH